MLFITSVLNEQQGIAQSVANSMVSGIVADIFSPEDRGRPMNVFVLATFFGQVCLCDMHVRIECGLMLVTRWGRIRMGRTGS